MNNMQVNAAIYIYIYYNTINYPSIIVCKLLLVNRKNNIYVYYAQFDILFRTNINQANGN